MKKLKNRVLYPQVTKTHEARPDSKTLRHMKKHQNIFRNTHIKKKKKKSEILRHIKNHKNGFRNTQNMNKQIVFL